MHPAIIIGTVRSLIVDVAMGQIPRSTERISSISLNFCLVTDLISSLNEAENFNSGTQVALIKVLNQM